MTKLPAKPPAKPPAKAGPMGEFEMIDKLLRPLARGFDGALDLGDDAALIDIEPGRQLVIAKDAIVETIHFLPDDPPETIAGKLLRTNLSDLAAMGADPLAYLMVLVRPRGLDEAWLRRFTAGLAADQKRFGLHLIGGDTVSTPGPLTLSLTILGTVPKGMALLRSGAAPGDVLLVSGTLGDAALGLRVLKGLAADDDQRLYLVDRYRLPQPRLELGCKLRGIASAAIDISDGLIADLGHICERSGVGAEIQSAALPLSAIARGMPAAIEAALAGGDDYELLVTVPHARLPELDGLGLTEIGRIVEGSGVTVLDPKGCPLDMKTRGWQHF